MQSPTMRGIAGYDDPRNSFLFSTSNDRGGFMCSFWYNETFSL